MKKFFWILMSNWIFFSCSTEVADEPHQVDSGIKVILLEDLSENDRTLKIRSETIEQQPCINFGLITEYSHSGKKLKIEYRTIPFLQIL